MDDVYRSAASVVLMRSASACAPGGCGDVYEVLLLQKPRKRDTWQLPQGGVEAGETAGQAALRELSEEAGISGVSMIGVSSLSYQYDFPASFRKFRPDHVCGQHIAFVFARAKAETPVKVDHKEIIGYAWVLPEQIPLYIRRKKYLHMVQALVQEGLDRARRS